MGIGKQFPLIADDEAIIMERPLMDLYDDQDLISNMTAAYQERQFASQTAGLLPADKTAIKPSQASPLVTPASDRRKQLETRPISEAQIARAQAREDLKKKRSAPYLNFDKPAFKSKELPKPQVSQRDLDKEQVSSLTKAANRLRQETYIRAEIKPVYQHSASPKEDKPQQNAYDFLRKSKLYTYQDKMTKETKKAQELDLTRLDQWKKR